MMISVQSVITAGAALAALASVVTIFWKLFAWIEHQKKQDEEITRIEARLNETNEQRDRARAHILEEQALLTYGILACLKGLKEQGCNGAVTEAINKIEKHINTNAHRDEV